MISNSRFLSGCLFSIGCILSSTAVAQTATQLEKPISSPKNQSSTKVAPKSISTSISENRTIEQIDIEIAQIDREIKTVQSDSINHQKALNNNWYVLMNDRKAKLQARKLELNSKK